MASGSAWPVLGIQPLNHPEHATQIIAEATALLELDNTKRNKLPAQSLEAFLSSVTSLAKKTREQPSGQELLGKLNNLQPIVDDITLIKNTVNNVLATPIPHTANTATRVASWADVVCSGTPSYPSTPNSKASTNISTRDRETIVKLDARAAAVLRTTSPEDLCKRVNDAVGSRVNLLGKAPKVIAAKQLRSGDVVLHTATTAEAEILKETEDEWTKILGTTARVVKPTYGVIAHGVRTNKESIDTHNQQRAIEKIESENARLHPGAKVAYVGWLTREGKRKGTSSLIVEFTTKQHANRVIREGLVLNAFQHDCVLYDRSCRLKQCYRCHEYGHIGPQCDSEERCGYCASAHNTKECMVKDTDPKPAPKCVLCKGQHTAWSNACSRRRRELARVEQARSIRPAFHYESDGSGSTPAIRETSRGIVTSDEAETSTPEGREAPTPLGPTEASNQVPNETPSQAQAYNLRQSIQPPTRTADQGWQTAHRRRRTRSPQKNTQRERSRSPGNRRGRQPLTERPANSQTGRRSRQDKQLPGETIQTLESFFQLTPTEQ